MIRSKGFPYVQVFSEAMFDDSTQIFSTLEKQGVDDIGYTGRTDYRTWKAVFNKKKAMMLMMPTKIA